ncbi:MAG: glycine zipper family protein [Candidatus Binatia bacterium]
MRRLTVAMVIALLFAGCASSAPPPPSVGVAPARGQGPEQQVRDQNECMYVAKGQTGYDPAGDTAKGAGVGAVVGALGGAAAGAAIGAATGNAGRGAAIGAAGGATVGAVGGGVYQHSAGKDQYNHAYANCMMGRGYNVSR